MFLIVALVAAYVFGLPLFLTRGDDALPKRVDAVVALAGSDESFAAARAFGRLLPSPPLYATAVGMGISRLYLGVHYPSDVAAGAALGTALGSLGR